MKISLSIYITSFLKGRRTFLERLVAKENLLDKTSDLSSVLSQFKSSGIDGIELIVRTRTTDAQLKQVKAMLQKNNIPVLSVHQPLSLGFSIHFRQIVRLFETANIVGAKVIVIHIFALRKNIHDPAFVAELKRLEKKYGIHIALENSTKSLFSRSKIHTWQEKAFTQMLSGIDFKVTMDTAHVGQAQEDIISFFHKNKNRIINIHLSDYKRRLYNSEHLPLGRGTLPITEFITLLKKEKYNQLLTFEITSSFENIFTSANTLQELLHKDI